MNIRIVISLIFEYLGLKLSKNNFSFAHTRIVSTLKQYAEIL